MKVKVKLINNKKNFRTFMLHKICKETKNIRENTEVIKKNTEPDKDIPMSAFFLLNLIATLFAVICIALMLVILYGLVVDLYLIEHASLIFIIISCLISLTSALMVLFPDKLHTKFPKAYKCIILCLFFSLVVIPFVLLILSDIYVKKATIYYKFIMCYILSILECLFIAVTKSINEENDKNYIVGYFSAITSLVALIISIIALIG